jgi:hypothetical protein
LQRANRKNFVNHSVIVREHIHRPAGVAALVRKAKLGPQVQWNDSLVAASRS